MAKIKTIAAQCQGDNLWQNMVLVAVRVEADMATVEATMAEVLHQATTMPTITHKFNLNNQVHTSSTRVISKICIENRGNYKVMTPE